MKKLIIATFVASLAVLPASAQENVKPKETLDKTTKKVTDTVSQKAEEENITIAHPTEATKAVETLAKTPKVEETATEPTVKDKKATKSKPKTEEAVKKTSIKMAPTTVPKDTSPVNLQSLRGDNKIANDSNKLTNKKWVNNDKIVARKYIQQPPMIPHSIDNYKITIQSNMCLRCHSWEAAQYTGATKISLTHFKDRDGNDLSSVSPSRYFCTQCHVPQVDAQPLIENEFKNAAEVEASN